MVVGVVEDRRHVLWQLGSMKRDSSDDRWFGWPVSSGNLVESQTKIASGRLQKEHRFHSESMQDDHHSQPRSVGLRTSSDSGHGRYDGGCCIIFPPQNASQQQNEKPFSCAWQLGTRRKGAENLMTPIPIPLSVACREYRC